VTHDQVEAMTLADRIVVLRGGHIEQVGTPDEIYSAPRTQFVASFMGAPPMNLMPVAVRAGSELLELAPGVVLPLPNRYAAAVHLAGRDALLLGIRPEHLVAAPSLVGAATAEFTFLVSLVEPLGSDTLVFLNTGAKELVARVPPIVAPRPGSVFAVGLDLGNAHLFDPETGRNLLYPTS